MALKKINAPRAPQTSGSYSQGIEVGSAARMLYISGQIPVTLDDHVPASFADQCLLVWRNVEAQLEAANMTFDNLVKVTTYLSGRQYREENSRIRRQVLGSHAPALTVIIAEIYDEAWLLEIEAIAAD